MGRNLRSLTVVMLSMMAMLALSGSAALAQEYPPPEDDADIAVACTTPVAGDDMTCNVTGAVPGETLEVTAEYNPVFYEATFTADENGEVSLTFDVPEEAEDQMVTVTVIGSESGEVATETEEAVAIDDGGQAVTPDESAALPVTGNQIMGLTVMGFVLLGSGLLVVRRREDAKTLVEA